MAASDVADTRLAGAGEARIEWADGQMPVLRSIRERFERERPLAGRVVGACLAAPHRVSLAYRVWRRRDLRRGRLLQDACASSFRRQRVRRPAKPHGFLTSWLVK